MSHFSVSIFDVDCVIHIDSHIYIFKSKKTNLFRKTLASLSDRFYARDSGILRFKIFPGLLTRSSSSSLRRLVAFTFHPYEPFAISVQRTNTEYVVNFHVRHQPNMAWDEKEVRSAPPVKGFEVPVAPFTSARNLSR